MEGDAIEEAAKRGKTNTALSAMEAQRKARASLVDERKREAGTLIWQRSRQTAPPWPPKAGRSRPRPRPSATWPRSSVPTPTASGRCLFALMVLCRDPLAIALTAATSARRA